MVIDLNVLSKRSPQVATTCSLHLANSTSTNFPTANLQKVDRVINGDLVQQQNATKPITFKPLLAVSNKPSEFVFRQFSCATDVVIRAAKCINHKYEHKNRISCQQLPRIEPRAASHCAEHLYKNLVFLEKNKRPKRMKGFDLKTLICIARSYYVLLKLCLLLFK